MKSNIVVIGKKSFIGKNLYNFSKKKRLIKLISLNEFLNLKNNKLSKIDIIINCTSNHDYISRKYNLRNDFDFLIAKKIMHLDIFFIFISTRKVYRNGINLNEKSFLKPKNNYSKNKLITENKLRKILKNKLSILRLSNIIGIRKKSQRRLHNTFIDNFFKNIKKGKVIKINNEYKDFLGINQLVRILDKVIEKKLSGTYNVSIGKKIYLKEIINWLNYFNLSNYKFIQLNKKLNNDSFTLNNNKLLKVINYKTKKKDLEKECKEISKKYFKN